MNWPGQAGGMTPELATYPGYRVPAEIISHAIWLYHIFNLSLRDVELILAERGIGSPPLDRLRREPYGEAATGSQAGIVFGPVGDPVPLLGNVTPAVGIGLERHSG
jgi:hypothetical protein